MPIINVIEVHSLKDHILAVTGSYNTECFLCLYLLKKEEDVLDTVTLRCSHYVKSV